MKLTAVQTEKLQLFDCPTVGMAIEHWRQTRKRWVQIQPDSCDPKSRNAVVMRARKRIEGGEHPTIGDVRNWRCGMLSAARSHVGRMGPRRQGRRQ